MSPDDVIGELVIKVTPNGVRIDKADYRIRISNELLEAETNPRYFNYDAINGTILVRDDYSHTFRYSIVGNVGTDAVMAVRMG